MLARPGLSIPQQLVPPLAQSGRKSSVLQRRVWIGCAAWCAVRQEGCRTNTSTPRAPSRWAGRTPTAPVGPSVLRQLLSALRCRPFSQHVGPSVGCRPFDVGPSVGCRPFDVGPSVDVSALRWRVSALRCARVLPSLGRSKLHGDALPRRTQASSRGKFIFEYLCSIPVRCGGG